MGIPSTQPLDRSRFIQIGDLFFLRGDETAWTVLGSCVSVMLHASQARLTLLCHAILPLRSHEGLVCHEDCPVACMEGLSCRDSRRYVRMVFPEMLECFQREGIPIASLRGGLFGGASLFRKGPRTMDIGAANSAEARSLFTSHGIPIIAEHTGGHSGRRVVFRDGSAVVTSTSA
ncbi:MAG: chemotaxis protein CheD [Spirochaetes bacterium]|nr:chemotaxis protein CheD [Spirochaetota bacterium]